MTTTNYLRHALLLSALLLLPAQMFAGVFISVSIAPPVLPVYVQPVCPAPGYIWTPGYWAYGEPDGYYWVPGTWVMAPQPGYLWTPGYWGWSGGVYLWNAGYWGPHVGFYGGVNYGFGYGGMGYAGGMWAGGVFRYNTAFSNVNIGIVHNTYVDRTVIGGGVGSRASFNGPNGIMSRPSAQEMAYGREQHMAATGEQAAHEHAASMDRNSFASVNHGRPAMAAVARPMSHPMSPGMSHPGFNDRPMSAQHGGGAATNHPAMNQGASAGHSAPQHYSEAPHNATAPHTEAQHNAAPEHNAAPQHNAPQRQQQHSAPKQEGHEGR
jgi:hypothetical protein